MSLRTKNLIWGVLLLIGITINSLYFVFGEGASEPAFNQVSVGMTEASVKELLGSPNAIKRNEEHTILGYGGFTRNKWCTMQVFINSDGRVTGKFHDH